MGLDTTHGCWSGPYSLFKEWRTAVAAAVGITLHEMKGFGHGRPEPGWRSWSDFAGDPIVVLLSHSDCDGSILAADCGPLAERLEQLVDKVPFFWAEATRDFVAGLRLAAAAGEDVEFY